MRKKHRDTLIAVYEGRPVRWKRLAAMLVAVGARLEDRRGSRVAVILEKEVAIVHRPHPSPETGKATVRDIRTLLQSHGIKP